jgi:hypothetical protein
MRQRRDILGHLGHFSALHPAQLHAVARLRRNLRIAHFPAFPFMRAFSSAAVRALLSRLNFSNQRRQRRQRGRDLRLYIHRRRCAKMIRGAQRFSHQPYWPIKIEGKIFSPSYFSSLARCAGVKRCRNLVKQKCPPSAFRREAEDKPR